MGSEMLPSPVSLCSKPAPAWQPAPPASFSPSSVRDHCRTGGNGVSASSTPACCQINKNHAKLNCSAQRLHLPLLENMSHRLTELRFLLPGTVDYFYIPLDRKQDTLPRSPPSSQMCSGENPLQRNTSPCICSSCGFGFCAWATASIDQRLWLAQQGIFWRAQGQREVLLL